MVRASDGREPRTTLTRALLEVAGEGEPRDLVEWAARASKGEIAALSVLVAREARAGDVVAARVIHRALGAIREHLVAALEGVGGWEGRPNMAMVGGLVGENGVLMEAVRGIAHDLGVRRASRAGRARTRGAERYPCLGSWTERPRLAECNVHTTFCNANLTVPFYHVFAPVPVRLFAQGAARSGPPRGPHAARRPRGATTNAGGQVVPET